ncbi:MULTISPECIES: hypothetical protein [Spirulina sp. CCY15215]|uniref:hypothetical protein n=1 Tax=Spirulina sp. CCY15215 TaxID=2767591 RepID=UPI001950BB5D|nr:hypothetical protein [Spirulina major]
MVKLITNKFFYWGIILSCLLGLSSCHPPPHCIIPIDTRASSFKVRFAQGKNCNRPPMRISSVEFYSRDNLGKITYLWRISSFPSQELVELQYGILPKNFGQVVAKPLIPDTYIEVEVDSVAGDGYLKIMITE